MDVVRTIKVWERIQK